jgi:predicted nucleic acid-binding protein
LIGIDSDFLIAFELSSHIRHSDARAILASILSGNEELAVAPQVFAEFLHIVTDNKRSSVPLDMATALAVTQSWRVAAQVKLVHTNDSVMSQFLTWMATHHLGRKRILDTMLAATYAAAGVDTLLTFNDRDFAVFGTFRLIPGTKPPP